MFFTDWGAWEIQRVLGHTPWFTPSCLEIAVAHQWAKAMKVLMPLQRTACEKKGWQASPARLSSEFVLPRVEAGIQANEVIAEYQQMLNQ